MSKLRFYKSICITAGGKFVVGARIPFSGCFSIELINYCGASLKDNILEILKYSPVYTRTYWGFDGLKKQFVEIQPFEVPKEVLKLIRSDDDSLKNFGIDIFNSQYYDKLVKNK